MPFHRAIPPSKTRSGAKTHSGASSGFGALVEAEKLMQIAFVLPAAVLIGWVAGWWLGQRLGLRWMEVAGVVFGCVAGLVYVVQIAVAAEKKTGGGDERPGGPGNRSAEL